MQLIKFVLNGQLQSRLKLEMENEKAIEKSTFLQRSERLRGFFLYLSPVRNISKRERNFNNYS